MPHRQKLRAVLSLVAVLTAYWAYTLLAVPLIEPQVVRHESSETPPSDGVDSEPNDLSALFPAGAWELDNPPKLKIEQGTLLFKDYRLLDDRHLKLESCTIILYSDRSGVGDATNKPPVILQSPDGATLEFASRGPRRRERTGQLVAGRLVGGRLTGQVFISRPPSRPGARDDLRIETRNVSISDQRLWTTHEVKFRYGDSYGSGRDLNVILLSKKNAGKSGQPFGDVNGLKSLELVHVQRFHLQLSEPGFPADEERTEEGGGNEDSNVEVEITCQGPFRFDFERGTAAFEDRVDVVNVRTNGVGDQLNCRLLEIHFATGSHRQQTENPTVTRAETGKLFPVTRPQLVVAFGHPVIARSPSSDFEARAQRLQYQIANKRVALSGDEPVQLWHAGHTITTRTLEYEMGRDGSIGRLWAGGPGSIKPLDGTDKSQSISAAWQSEVRLRPQNGQHVLSLLGQAEVEVSGLGRISADKLHCWLRETVVDRSEKAERDSPLGVASAALAPSRLLAEDGVRVDSPQLLGQAQRLEVWLAKPTVDASLVSDPPNTTDSSPGQPPVGLGLVAGNRNGPMQEQLRLRGKVIQVEMQPSASGPVVANFTVDGNVSVAAAPPRGAAGGNMSIVGDILRVRNAHSDTSEIVVRGSPAKIRFGEMSLSGNLIRFDQSTRQTSIEGPGTLVTMVERDLQANALSNPQVLRAAWKGKMEFDGIRIHVEKGVDVNTRDGRVEGDVLDITLDRRVDFLKTSSTDDVQPRRVEFTGNVRAEYRTVVHGSPQAIDRMHVPALSIDLVSGRLHAAGPGRLTTVRYVASTFFPASSDVPIASMKADNSTLSFLGVEYQKSLTGNVNQRREFHFEDYVRTVYGPVSDWNENLDADAPEGLRPQEFLMTCRRLSLYELGKLDQNGPAFELTATGNTIVEGKTFTALAHRITYSKPKDVLIIEGGPRNDAELWYEDGAKGPATYLPARKIFYWPNTQRIKVEEVGTPTVSGF